MTQPRCAKCNMSEVLHKYGTFCSGFEPKYRKRAPRIPKLKTAEEIENEEQKAKSQEVTASDQLLTLLTEHHGEDKINREVTIKQRS